MIIVSTRARERERSRAHESTRAQITIENRESRNFDLLRKPGDSWELLDLLKSVHAGKIDDLHKYDKSYNIENYFL